MAGDAPSPTLSSPAFVSGLVHVYTLNRGALVSAVTVILLIPTGILRRRQRVEEF